MPSLFRAVTLPNDISGGTPLAIEIPERTTKKWQRVVDLTARLADVPACLLMRTAAPDHRVFITSNSEGNPYPVGRNFTLNPNLYCEAVLRTGDELVVHDANIDPDWDSNEDLELGMSFYVGQPIRWPDGSLFGTICVLDRSENARALLHRDLLTEFRGVIEADLALLAEIERRERAEAELEQRVETRTRKLAAAKQELEDANTALRVLVSKLEGSRQEVEEQLRRQITGLILPNLMKLRDTLGGREPDEAYLSLIEESLTQITSSFANTLVGAFERLTPTETEIAQLVMSGRTTKDIARALSREPSTIDFHRNNIRKKLGIDSRRVNLRTHLRSLAG